MTTYRLAAVAAVTMALSAVVPAAAQVQVSDLRVSDVESGDQPHKATLPETTRTIYVSFDYAGADRSTVVVSLEGLGGLPNVYSRPGTYSGNSRAVVAIAGSDVYKSLAARLYDLAAVAQGRAKQAAEQELGRREYLSQANSAAVEMNQILDVLIETKLDVERTRQLNELRQPVATLSELAEEALALNYDQQSAMQAKATEMKAAADSALARAKTVKDDAPSVGSVPFPPSGNGEYTVQLLVSTAGSAAASPAIDAAFQVRGAGQPAADSVPAVGGAPTSGAAAQPTSAVGAGAPTARTGPQGAVGAPTSAGSKPGATAIPGGSAAANATVRAAGGVTPGASGLARAGTDAAPGAPGTGSMTAGGPDFTPAAASGQTGVGSGQSGTEGGAAPSGAMPTWTVPAPSGQLAQLPPTGATTGRARSRTGSGASNQNLVVMALGVAGLAGVAFWLRRRG